MSCVNIRGCCIGEGRPKVIIPIVEPTETAVLKKAAEFSTLRADCVEWRIDCFEGAKDLPAIVHCAAKLRVALKDKLLLFTFRTKAEGGKVALSHEEYLHFIRTVLATDCADLIDIEPMISSFLSDSPVNTFLISASRFALTFTSFSDRENWAFSSFGIGSFLINSIFMYSSFFLIAFDPAGVFGILPQPVRSVQQCHL